jgi:hypothetical protein
MITAMVGGKGAMITAELHLGHIRTNPKEDHALAREVVC